MRRLTTRHHVEIERLLIFDNTKIRRVVPDYHPTIPFHHGAAEVIAWYDADPARRVVDAEMDALMDRIIAERA